MPKKRKPTQAEIRERELERQNAAFQAVKDRDAQKQEEQDRQVIDLFCKSIDGSRLASEICLTASIYDTANQRIESTTIAVGNLRMVVEAIKRRLKG